MTQENENLKPENKEEIKNKEASFEFKKMIARKMGMAQIYTEAGDLKGVTVLQAGPCKITYLRTKDKDGYNAVCLGFENIKESKVNSPLKGIFKKNNVEPSKYLKEFRVDKVEGFENGQIVSLNERFKVGDFVDVQGVSIGKGFAGGMKRHNFKGQPASHGASDRERAPGGLASRRSLGRVMPGQRMAGHLGMETLTMHKLKIEQIIPEKNLILINGSVPGKEGSIVYITNTVKRIKKAVVMSAKSKTKKEIAKTTSKGAQSKTVKK